ncbi:MAG: InlB B-repeat-containing protein, partial [Eubacteriales bacterium]
MKRINKILALIIGVVMLLSAMCIPALAYSYPMAVTIYYKNEAGYSVATSISTTINAADTDKPTWASPNISGYALKNESDAVVTYEMLDKSFPASNYDRNGSGTYTVIYQKLYTHAVKCVNAKTGAFIWSCTTEGKTGQSYSITLPSITGITPAKSTVTGTFGSSDTSETVYYYPTIYTVTYDANGGSGAPGSQTKEHGQTLTLSSRTPTRYGYSFLGWSRSSTATSASFSPGGSYTGNYSATLYAVWDPNQYTVTLDANGGNFSVSELTKYYGKTLQLPSEIPVLDGYLFLGWSTDKNATIANYSAGGNYTSNSSCTLYAVWEKELERYAVYFNANGGTDAPA